MIVSGTSPFLWYSFGDGGRGHLVVCVDGLVQPHQLLGTLVLIPYITFERIRFVIGARQSLPRVVSNASCQFVPLFVLICRDVHPDCNV
jgi:hypothetical protein